MYTLDTNAIIYYSKGDEKAIAVLEDVFVQETPLYISAVTEIELFGFSGLTPHDGEQFERFLRAVTVIPVDSRVARIAGAIRRDHRIKTIDSAIAATALLTGSTLVTRNIRDFKKLPWLKILPL